MPSPKRAIVLSGGGARGAYEAGVLRYIVEELPKDLGHPVRFDVICGTSVGAINSAWLAATIDEPAFCVQRLWYLWRTLEFPEVMRPSLSSMWKMLRSLVSREISDADLEDPHHGGLLYASFFRDLIERELPIDNIQRNLGRGLIDALTVSTTNIVTGQTTVFAQTARSELPPWTRDPRRVAIGGPITADKILASAAIPFVFPPVKIGKHWFCDGGIRQNTPLSPALRLDADRVLVISLLSDSRTDYPDPFDPSDDAVDHAFPPPAMMLGKLLDAVLLDPIDYDLAVLKRINGILRQGAELQGALNEVIRTHRGQPYRIVEPLLLRPSQDLGRIAQEFAAQVPESFWGSRLMAAICAPAANRAYEDNDLMSFLLFDGGYTGQLLDMGYSDAKESHDELLTFFQD
ncbi:patatin-like phospholipase family protein [Bradymonas sediminis]|nr:patatin-like phospholipase family protein [Bradymonas sediminis]TDP75368.1 NTE family protein [Bradymonas sediminis]